MNKKMSKRQKDIKSKLMAAICMLLVSSIMMVSTTYAWFTLSTAPEVTGITTAVGANGNLEMALLPPTALTAAQADDYGITSAAGDSTKLDVARNITWGNLVDVSDFGTYGLNNINLYPAKLNVETLQDGEETVYKVGARPLQTPQYGADGRVSTLEANTITGAFDMAKGQFLENANGISNAMGVRAIGEASSMSARQLAYRTAVANASTYSGQSLNTAKTSLGNRGSALATIAMNHATNNDNYTQTDIDALKGAVSDLESAVDKMETALKNLIIADSIAPATVTDDTYKAIVDAITAAEDWDDVRAVDGVMITPEMETMIAKFNDTQANVATASTKVNALVPTTDWSLISGALSTLMDTSAMTINGKTMESLQGENGKSELINAVIDAGFKVNLNMSTGSGAYADLADFGGNYSATIKVNVTYENLLQNKPVDATMNVITTYEPALIAGYSAASFSGGDGASTSNPITEYYGYIIDLAFKTNAAGSKLQLQKTAIDRVYTDSTTNENTMGHGASMSFESTSTSFNDGQVKSLMGHIRIVFFDPHTMEIINYAKLDMNAAVPDNGKVTAPIMLTDSTFATDAGIEIMALDQNTAHAMSVMVYLDGETMTNADVAADQVSSMTGSMNLQFSSSANLKPMEYSDLRGENGGATGGYTAIRNVSVPTGWRATSAYLVGDKLVFSLTGDTTPTSVTVSIDGGAALDATFGTYNGIEGYAVTVADASAVTASSSVAITVDGVAPAAPATPDGGDDTEGEGTVTYYCGKTEHAHSEDCDTNPDEEGIQCEIEEHIHVAQCEVNPDA